MDPNKHIEDIIRSPLNRSLIGYSSRRSNNLKTYFINIKSGKNSSKIFIKEDEVDYFTKIIEQANKDLADKKLLLKKARENKERFKKIKEDLENKDGAKLANDCNSSNEGMENLDEDVDDENEENEEDEEENLDEDIVQMLH